MTTFWYYLDNTVCGLAAAAAVAFGALWCLWKINGGGEG